MPGRQTEIARRGKYWLAWDRRVDGTLRSPNIAIFWYDSATRRNRSASTGTSSEEAALIALDRRYLADRGQAAAYCGTCGQPLARATAYLLADAIADYRLEVGDGRDSGDSIAARLKHVVDFLEAEGLAAASCADACTPGFADRFRTWSRRQPVTWRNKAGDVTVSRPRAPATTEESLVQLAAALNHAANEKRSDTRPDWRPLRRAQVSQRRRVRVDEAVLATFLRYAAEPKKRRGALHAFLVAEICTLARPDAVIDISTAPHRRQWLPGAVTLDLNPVGRAQTHKYRPLLPVMPLLGEWLKATFDDAEAESSIERTAHWLVNYYGKPVRDVDSSWEAMLIELGHPLDREWRPYLLRHSLATLLRSAGVPLWELQGFMGHKPGGMTETYAVENEFPGVCRALQQLLDELETRAPGALHRNRTGSSSNVLTLRRPNMPSG